VRISRAANNEDSSGANRTANVRGNAGPAVGRLAREQHDDSERLAGQVARRWASR
jgi:hypothetical protein